MLKHGS